VNYVLFSLELTNVSTMAPSLQQVVHMNKARIFAHKSSNVEAALLQCSFDNICLW